MGSTLVAGATGATGRLLVRELLDSGERVVACVRSPEKLPEAIRNHPRLSVIAKSPLDLTDEELSKLVAECDAVASCLGHNISFKGIWGKPRRLVTDFSIRICSAIAEKRSARPTKFVLMNTAGNRNRDLHESRSLAETILVALLRALVPPHADNEDAADHLRSVIGQKHASLEWVAVRPDTLEDREKVTDYDIHPSPTPCALFNAGRTSRINVAHFMAQLILRDELWSQWKGSMPVIYNCEEVRDRSAV